MPEVFISYSRKDADYAEVLRGRLRDAGFCSWIDLEGLQAGEEWCQEIDQAIRDSVALVVLLTPASRASAYVAYEWAFALGAGVRVIPILWIATDVPHRLANLQHLDFIAPDNRPWKSLLNALEAATQSRPTHAIRIDRSAPALVKQSAAALDSPEPGVMETAMRRLAEMKSPEADDVLVQALNHPLPDVRIEAGLHLGRRKDPRAVPCLIEGNRRRRWHWELARQVAAVGSAAIPIVREALNDPVPWMRRDLVWALRLIDDPAAVPDLVRLLEDSDAEVRKEVIQTLGGLRTPDALQALVELSGKADGENWLLALEALQKSGTAEALEAVRKAEAALVLELRAMNHGKLSQSTLPRGDRVAAILKATHSESALAAANEWLASIPD
ncbi:MAG: HEAT repeat domain-containing protein [Limisphaerales bacterium]